MFKHCLSKFSCALVMMCALVTGGLFQSCKDVFDLDEYKYDDSEPTWLGASIYEFLKEGNAGHTYENYVKLIEDLDEKDILSRTGSRTLFIADDAAFERFYEGNAWGVKSYEDFTYRQKRVLLYNVMLKNAYLLDMLAATSVSPNQEQLGGDCLRRETSATLYDSVPIFSANSEVKGLQFPKNNKCFDLWEKEYIKGNSIRIALGNSNPMMVHFLYEYVRSKNILDEDFSIIFKRDGKTRTGTEAFVFANKILNSDVSYGDLSDDTLTITCKNGYLYRMDDVLIPPSNMAQVLRETPSTSLFSRMLDRFAYLEYSSSASKGFNDIYHKDKPEDNENVYLLKYAVDPLNGGDESGQAYYKPDQDGKHSSTKLRFEKYEYVKYDPGNAQHKVEADQDARVDMAAMLVPNDTMIYRFFAPERLQDAAEMEKNYTVKDGKRVQLRPYGVGASIIETYANAEDVANLKEVPGFKYAEAMAPCIDSIPMDILSAFLCNLMQKSFLSTLPSNFDKVRNDARDDMGLQKSDVSDCVLANNGVIYILNNVYGPAKYQAVMTPPLVLTNMRVMNSVIADLNYEAYLLAMDATYSFIVPDDTCFVYYDPKTLKSQQPTAYIFGYGKAKATDSNDNLICTKCAFDTATYALGDTLEHAKQVKVSDYKNALTDLMEYFIIVDDVEGTKNQYFLSKGYGIVKCVKEGDVVKFQGGEQLELSRKLGRDVFVTIKDLANGPGRYVEKNGITYCTNSQDETYKSGVISAPTRSIYSYLAEKTGDNPFSEFYELCEALSDKQLMDTIFDWSDVEDKDGALSDSLDKYRIFSDAVDGKIPFDQAVPFFSTYHYTVYVPQASAVQEAIAKGLPQYDDIWNEAKAGNLGRAASMMRQLNRFIRYHFQDNSVLVDKEPFKVKVADDWLTSIKYETSTIDETTGRFYELLIKSDNGTITITDGLNNVASVMKDGQEGKTWNVLTRDILFTGDPSSDKGADAISSSSFAVVHKIDKALYNKGFYGYDGNVLRFADGGEIVNQWTNISVPASYDATNDKAVYETQTYLIGEGKYKANGKITGYLLKKASNPGKFDKEDYIAKALSDTTYSKILITQDGFLVDTLGTNKKNPIRFLRADFTPLPVDETGAVDPDSIVTVLKDGTFVDNKGRKIE